MALLTWRERNTKGQEVGPTWYLDFEATVLEEFSRSALVTDFPIENGAILSDHYQPQPRAITLDVFVSNTAAKEYQRPDEVDAEAQNAAAPAPGVVGPLALDLPVDDSPVAGLAGQRLLQGNISRLPRKRTASVLQFTGRVKRVVDVFQVLDGLIQSGQLVNVILYNDLEIKDMMIVNVQTPRTADDGEALRFSIDLVQLSFADTETQGLNDNSPQEVKQQPRAPRGGRNGKPTTLGTRAASGAQTQPWFAQQNVTIPAA